MLPIHDAAGDRQRCIIAYPPTWRAPKFHLGQRVYFNRCDSPFLWWGEVCGIYYAAFNDSWHYSVRINEESELLEKVNLPDELVTDYPELWLSEVDTDAVGDRSEEVRRA